MTARTVISAGSALRRAVARFSADAGGLAALEAAIILPVALLIMSLVVYGGQLYSVQRKVTLSASTVANLLAQGGNNGSATIATAELNQILAYPNLVLYPNDPTGVQVVASQLLVAVNPTTGAATGTVVQSWANANATKRPIGQQLSVDPSIAAAFTGQANAYVIFSEVQYPFQPPTIDVAVGAITLHDSVMMIPRTAAQITVQ